MLIIKIPPQEAYDPNTNRFITCDKEYTLKLEHSLLSISKWETQWKKSYIGTENKSYAEFIDYIKCMTINQDVPDIVYTMLTTDDVEAIGNYINDPATATVVNDYSKKKGASKETPTSELIYYWMISNGIPFECEKWRLNRLLTLIKICNAKGNPSQMSRQEIYAMNTQLNAARKKKLGING